MIEIEKINSLKFYLRDYLQNNHGITNLKKAFHCLSPNHTDNNPSMHYSSKYNLCKCFSCNTTYDIFDLIKLDYGITNFKEQCNKVAELYDENIKIDVSVKPKTFTNYINKDYSKYFQYCHNSIWKTNYLTKERGLDERLIDKYEIGYDEDKQVIIFPINNNCYFARSVNGNEKYKSSGTSFLWNEQLLNEATSTDFIYLTESIIDALSLETINPDIKVISLNGTTNMNRLLNLLDNNFFTGTFVIAFDNDSVGKTCSTLLKDELKKRNIQVFNNSLINCEYKDINEAMFFNKDKVKGNLNYFNNSIKKILEDRKAKEEDSDYEV